MKVLKQVKIVLWAFLGVRSEKGKNDDIEEIKNPLVFIGIGFVLFLLFVFSLIIGVHLIV